MGYADLNLDGQVWSERSLYLKIAKEVDGP